MDLRNFRRLMRLAERVTCDDCDWQIKPFRKPPNYRRLALGCPGCGGHQWTFDFPDEAQNEARRLLDAVVDPG
jgi:hypothetical protein